jgi:hypothetical protein
MHLKTPCYDSHDVASRGVGLQGACHTEPCGALAHVGSMHAQTAMESLQTDFTERGQPRVAELVFPFKQTCEKVAL